MGKPISMPTFCTLREAATFLTKNGYIETNAGWLRSRHGNHWIATIVDLKDEARGVSRSFRVSAERCDEHGKRDTSEMDG